ncbi:MAG: hypothetical protein VW683_01385 [Betaproteobacteria bacterium]|jgi:hypothetical protein
MARGKGRSVPPSNFARSGTPAPQQVQVDISQAETITCDNCHNLTFQSVLMFKKISAIMSPTGQEAIVPIETYRCSSCGNINTEFLPKFGRPDQEQPTPAANPSNIISTDL